VIARGPLSFGFWGRDWRRVVYWGGRQRADLYTARVAFVASKRGDFRSALFIVNADGTGLRRLWPK
jgi:hypothetical protein